MTTEPKEDQLTSDFNQAFTVNSLKKSQKIHKNH